MFASAISGFFANFVRRNFSVPSVGRWYIHDSRPSANMFLLRSASLRLRLELLERLDGQRGQRHRMDAVAVQRAVLQRAGRVADLRHRPLGELVRVDDDLRAARHIARCSPSAPPGSSRPARSARHPGVRMSWSAKCSWKRRDARQGAGGGPDLGREVRQRRQVVAEGRRLGGETVTGELHTVTGVTREPDDHPVQTADLLVRSAVTGAARRRRLVPAGLLTWLVTGLDLPRGGGSPAIVRR